MSFRSLPVQVFAAQRAVHRPHKGMPRAKPRTGSTCEQLVAGVTHAQVHSVRMQRKCLYERLPRELCRC